MSDSEEREMWFLAKNLKTLTRLLLSTTSLWEISRVQEKPQLWKRVAPSCKSVEEFRRRAEAEKLKKVPKPDYGVVEGEWMYRYTLLEASGKTVTFVESFKVKL